jgi:hypothetical protein
MYHDRTAEVPADIANELSARLSRAADIPTRIERPGLHLAYIDLGLHPGAPVHCEADGSFTYVSGDPLLDVPNRPEGRTRDRDLPLIHADLRADRDDALTLARDMYCAVSFDPRRQRLTLVTDKMGVRVIYIYSDERLVFFCSHFRIRANVGFIARRPDRARMATIAAFEGPVGDMLPFEGTHRLRACETITFENGSQRRHRYWSWAAIATRHRSPDDLACRAAEIVRDSVRLRLRGMRDAVAYLSGGLDSRLITACLREAGAEVRSYNFAPKGIADQVFGRLFAEVAGSRHTERPLPLGHTYPNWSTVLSDALKAETGRPTATLAWHGFDASVTMGYVHMQDPVVPLLRQRRFDDAVDEYIRRRRLTWAGHERILQPRFAKMMTDGVRNFIWSALHAQMPEDPAKALLIFHIENGSPALYINDFEDVDLHRVVWMTPLADFRLTEFMPSVDPVLCVGHAFYMKVLEHLPSAVTSVPWQAYPGHMPCPLPAPPISMQWEMSKAKVRFAFRRADKLLANILRGPLPTDVIRPLGLAQIAVRHAARAANCDWHFKRIAILQRYLRASKLSRTTAT